MRKIQMPGGLVRLWARISGISGSRHEQRKSLIRLVAGGFILCGAVALPLTLTTLQAAGALPLFAAIAIVSSGALSLVLVGNKLQSTAARVQSIGMVAAGCLLAWAAAAPFMTYFCLVAIAALHDLLLAREARREHTILLGGGAALILGASMAFPQPAFVQITLGAAALFQILAVLILCRTTANAEEPDRHVFAHLVDSFADGLLQLQPNGHLLHATENAEKMFGCRAYSLSGPGLLERVHVLDRPGFLKTVSDTAHDGTTRTTIARVRRDEDAKSGRETRFVWAEISTASAPGANADAPVFALIRDISSRKEQEQKLEEARREAVEAAESKSRFLATMGHELRTPLNAIVGFAEMMSAGIGGQLDDTHAEYADMIGQSGRHLLDVVNMLLDMSKINAGKFELHLAEFEPATLVDPSLYMVSALARSRQVEIETDISDALPIIKGDERACRQIIINLLSNAIKFSPPDGKVNLTMRRQGAKLNITVSDNGIGMTREQVERIGEPFFQAHAGLSRQYEGTGLGLSIVKGLVDLHDGALRARSAPDEGTAVTVLLPLLGPETHFEGDTVTRLNAPEAGPAPQPQNQLQDQPQEQSIAS